MSRFWFNHTAFRGEVFFGNSGLRSKPFQPSFLSAVENRVVPLGEAAGHDAATHHRFLKQFARVPRF